jgi:hypothetical protein
MAIDSRAVLQALNSLLETVVQDAFEGEPMVGGARIIAVVTAAGEGPSASLSSQLLRQPLRFHITLGYALDGDSTGAEEAMCLLKDALRRALYAAMRTKLGGVVDSLEAPDFTPADNPDYRVRAGDEYREYPIVVTAWQQETF